MKCSSALRGRFAGLLKRFDRIVITGPSGCGKSTLADEVRVDDRPILRSDDFKQHSWEEVPWAIITAAAKAGPSWTFEGVMGARALRKGLQCDAVVYLDKPRRPQLPGQVAQGKGIMTVFREWRQRDQGRTPVFFLAQDLDEDED